MVFSIVGLSFFLAGGSSLANRAFSIHSEQAFLDKAFSVEACEIKWSFDVYGVITKGGMAVGLDDTLYASTSEGWVYALNPNGSAKWTAEFLLDEPLIIRGTDQYEELGNIEGEVPDSIIILDEVFENDDFSHASPTLSGDGQTLYISGRISGNVYALNRLINSQ